MPLHWQSLHWRKFLRIFVDVSSIQAQVTEMLYSWSDTPWTASIIIKNFSRNCLRAKKLTDLVIFYCIGLNKWSTKNARAEHWNKSSRALEKMLDCSLEHCSLVTSLLVAPYFCANSCKKELICTENLYGSPQTLLFVKKNCSSYPLNCIH